MKREVRLVFSLGTEKKISSLKSDPLAAAFLQLNAKDIGNIHYVWLWKNMWLTPCDSPYCLLIGPVLSNRVRETVNFQKCWKCPLLLPMEEDVTNPTWQPLVLADWSSAVKWGQGDSQLLCKLWKSDWSFHMASFPCFWTCCYDLQGQARVHFKAGGISKLHVFKLLLWLL